VGEVVQLAWDTPASVNLAGRIVCIENADPGFDWIFARSPAGLVTKFGGANSHMAVRCAELSLPAAIGCGEQLYLRVTAAGRAELDCAESILRPQHA
jgi:phosphoenolpyruvate-protein kinase (PTS system EI component)